MGTSGEIANVTFTIDGNSTRVMQSARRTLYLR
jgi:hypothetical protein